MQESLELLKNLNIAKTDYIIVGCSGGADSMCLLHLLTRNGYKVVCAHVNHNIRKESYEEYDSVKEYCEKNDIIFEGIVFDKTNANEYYYRKKRYTFYKFLADKYHTKYILTAHHGDDLIETILMRITRGSNLKGYEGFSKVFNEHGYLMIKPLIYYTKEEIYEYNRQYNIPYYEDKTNQEETYTRNRYRHNILPFLKSENKNIHRKYLKFSEELSKAKNYIKKETDRQIEDNYKDNTIDLKKFSKLDDYIKECELETIFSNIYKDDIDKIHKHHVQEIINLIKKGKNFNIDLPLGYSVKREYEKLYIKSKTNVKKYNIEFKEYQELPNGYVIERIEDTQDTSNYVIRINSNEIALPIYIRNKKTGDKIHIKNMESPKKVKKIFIDEKVLPSLRESWPIIVDKNDNIIWLPGLKKSKFDNDKSQKYDIILRYRRKENNNEK